MNQRQTTWTAAAAGLAVACALGCALLLGPSDAELGAIRAALARPDALLLDVRSPEEHAERRLEGAVNVPVGELEGRLAELGARERPVVVFCRSGFRSARAASLLREAGFVDVHDLGGIANGGAIPLEQAGP